MGGVPGAPTAREFAKTERMRNLLAGAMTDREKAQLADPEACVSFPVVVGGGAAYDPGSSAGTGGDAGKLAVFEGCCGQGICSILRDCATGVCGDRLRA